MSMSWDETLEPLIIEGRHKREKIFITNDLISGT